VKAAPFISQSLKEYKIKLKLIICMKKINCILLVDDNPYDNEFHKIIIKKADVCNHMRVVNDGIEALVYIMNAGKPGQENDYLKANLIFLDINRPRMNGFEFLEKYTKIDENLKSSGVIIMLTTSLNPDDNTRASVHKEVTEFLNKPLDVKTLLEISEKYF
jgi:CheY-like chemotaxis protein